MNHKLQGTQSTQKILQEKVGSMEHTVQELTNKRNKATQRTRHASKLVCKENNKCHMGGLKYFGGFIASHFGMTSIGCVSTVIGTYFQKIMSISME